MTQDEALMWMLLSQQMMQPAPVPAAPVGPKIQCFGGGNSFHCY